ncbi:MAG: M28 family peptidase [Chthoniobacterales bacterium]
MSKILPACLIAIAFPISSALTQTTQGMVQVNDTAQELIESLHGPALWSHLVDFQRIADENPGPNGHGNRDTGTPGYKASVDYVVGLMREAGYRVTIQPYLYRKVETGPQVHFTVPGKSYVFDQDWFVARLSAGGTISAPVEPVRGSGSGGVPEEWTGFVPGRIALLQRGSCSYDVQVANACAAGAAAIILYNHSAEDWALEPAGPDDGSAFQARLTRPAAIPVIGVASFAMGADLRRQCEEGHPQVVRLDIPAEQKSGVDYNVIAESPFGDADHVVVVDAHLDSIYGAGILDNASGSSTILEVALQMAKTPTRNRLRYIWFGGEEIGLLGSRYYTENLSAAERRQISFDVDVDVTATPNYDYLVADPAFAPNVQRFPPNVVPQSRVGNQFFADYFETVRIPSRPAWFGNEGTDSNSFSLIGIPNTGILTQQNCCKKPWEIEIWGGVLGNYEGKIPSFNGGCVDFPHRWCDNLDNNDPAVLEVASKACASAIFQLANFAFDGDSR